MPLANSAFARYTVRRSWLLVLTGAALASSLVPRVQPAIAVYAAANFAPRATFTIPGSNVASSGPVLDNRHVIYGFAAPRIHRHTCVNCYQMPFTNFHVQIYIRDYQRRSTSITVSPQRLLFVGPRGAQIVLYSLSGGWLVYETYKQEAQWRLRARNVVTGRAILLDSSAMEGQYSRLFDAGSDGRTVVWQSSSQIFGPMRLGVRFYTFATGRRQFLPSPGTSSNYTYTSAQINGHRLILVKASRETSASQIVIENLTTHHIRVLTPPGQQNFEPYISGNIIVWVHGSISIGHTHGLVVANLATGRRVALKRSSSQLPRIAAGRYIVFATDYLTPRLRNSVQVYDALSGQRRTFATDMVSGFSLGQAVEAGGDAALFRMTKQCSAANGVCPTRFTLISLGPWQDYRYTPLVVVMP